MITILKPTIGLHPGGSFRELMDIWAERNFCRVVPNTLLLSDPNIEETERPEARPWVNSVGDILLYDNTILDKLDYIPGWNKALFANEVKHGENCFPWIFWARFPRKYFKYQETPLKGFCDRENESIFVGNFTTGKRAGDWGHYLSYYFMGSHNQHHEKNMAFDYETYLSMLENSRFGLCLPGQGPKCLRDVELMGLGTVPIFTPGVSTDYYNKFSEGEHYLFAPTPKDIPNVIANCSEKQWKQMSEACLEWFKKNCSVEGSWKTTMEILNG